MNKAFVREDDGTGPETCPLCGSKGLPVGVDTLRAHVPPTRLQQFSEAAWFCPAPRCAAVYFDRFERVVSRGEVTRPVCPKDPTAPLCACFGLTRDDVEADVREGGVRRLKAWLARAQSPEARCASQSPSGQSCIEEVQRYYFRTKSAGETPAGHET